MQEGSDQVAENKGNEKVKKPHKRYDPLKDMFNVQNCPICGRDFVIPDAGLWTYKRRGGKDGKKMFYFCTYGCKNKYVKAHEEQKELNYKKGRKKQTETMRANRDGMEQVQE